MIKSLFIAATTIAIQITPATAQERLPDVPVDYSDLDLSTPAGVKKLDRRLSSAIEAACPDDHGVRELSRMLITAKCRAEKHAQIAPLRANAIHRTTKRKSPEAERH